QQDGMIASDAQCPRAVIKNFVQLPRDPLVGVVERKRVDGQVSVIANAPLRKRIHIEHRVPGPDHAALCPYMARSEARPRAVRRAAIKGNSNQGNIEFLRARNMRQAHEGCDARKTGINESIDWRWPRTSQSFGLHGREL